MLNTPSSRIISMTYWYPILAELQHTTLINPITEDVVGDNSNGKFSLKTVKVDPPKYIVRVPDTIFVHYPYSRKIWELADGKEPRGFDNFIMSIHRAALEFGYPIFLRTESSSDKHSWKETCYVNVEPQESCNDVLKSHVYGLVEHSLMADIPCDFFAIRRLIPTEPICTAFRGDMPIAKECRVFVKNGQVVCHHPYWPDEAFKNVSGKSVTRKQIDELQNFSDNEVDEITGIATLISRHIPGWWSVDFLKDKDGNWWCIDMAIGQLSYHWDDCPHKKEPER